jgi:hypothetical protein
MLPEIEGKSPDDEYDPFKAHVFSVGVCLLQSLKTTERLFNKKAFFFRVILDFIINIIINSEKFNKKIHSKLNKYRKPYDSVLKQEKEIKYIFIPLSNKH